MFFFFNDTATTEIYTLSLHDALPIFTHAVLTQIIMEEEQRGATMLPVNFLRQLIGLYGNSMQAAVPQYLEASLEAFQRNQSQLSEAMAGALAVNPFAEMARRNMEMFAAAEIGIASCRER